MKHTHTHTHTVSRPSWDELSTHGYCVSRQITLSFT